MSEELDIHAIELQEMARIILCEIYSAKKPQSTLVDADYFAEASHSDFRFDNGVEGSERRRAIYRVQDGFQSQFGEEARDGEFYPKLSRREFLEQRMERRIQRENSFNSAVKTAAEADGKSIKQYGNLTQADLPEKLSDIFCRDARRYDGAYERY